jgi:hypothetical protein
MSFERSWSRTNCSTVCEVTFNSPVSHSTHRSILRKYSRIQTRRRVSHGWSRYEVATFPDFDCNWLSLHPQHLHTQAMRSYDLATPRTGLSSFVSCTKHQNTFQTECIDCTCLFFSFISLYSTFNITNFTTSTPYILVLHLFARQLYELVKAVVQNVQ